MVNFNGVFEHKPIIGMLHLFGGETGSSFGRGYQEITKRALEELTIFQEEGLDGAIVENYGTSEVNAVHDTLESISKLNLNIKIGVNILPNEFATALGLARRYNADFIQLDYVAGAYTRSSLKIDDKISIGAYYKEMERLKKLYDDKLILGGVWPKYYSPLSGSKLKNDLKRGMKRCDAIVVTGRDTGKETPLDKINEFRGIIGGFPLIIGAGLTPDNAYEQLRIADGAIVGSYLKKDGIAKNKVDRIRVKRLMDVVKDVRKI